MEDASVLIIEDDRELAHQLAELLAANGMGSELCHDGETGLLRATSGQHQLVLLDVMLPERDGFSLLKILRRQSAVPVVMVTAKDAEQEKIQGFSHGADDYVAKPFNSTELILRIQALLRRSLNQSPQPARHLIALDTLEVNARAQQVAVAGQPLDLSPIQFDLLWELLVHQGEVLSKAYLYQRVLKRNLGAHDRSLDMHVSRIRRKLKEAHWPGDRLKTAHGRGYSLV